MVSSLFGYSTRQDLDSAYAELFFTVGMTSKQKYKSLSVKQKLEILERLDHLPAHKKKKDKAAEFGIYPEYDIEEQGNSEETTCSWQLKKVQTEGINKT